MTEALLRRCLGHVQVDIPLDNINFLTLSIPFSLIEPNSFPDCKKNSPQSWGVSSKHSEITSQGSDVQQALQNKIKDNPQASLPSFIPAPNVLFGLKRGVATSKAQF